MNKSLSIFSLILLLTQSTFCQTPEEKLEQIRFRGGDREVVRVFSEEELDTKVASKVTKLNLTDSETSRHLAKYYSASPLLSQWEKDLPMLPAAEEFSNSLVELENLEELNIEGCPIFFAYPCNKNWNLHVKFFFESLTQCKKLKTLKLGSCGIENATENILAKGLCSLLENTKLESLDIDILRLFSAKNYSNLILATRNSNLKKLKINLAESIFANMKNKVFFDFKEKLTTEMKVSGHDDFEFIVEILI
jgi:hypothetical protein